jgi:sterol desaturase/sphingolipid hydroxylase (fatty acid hydroxylase superfamily)
VHLSRWVYLADFVVYPVAAALFVLAGMAFVEHPQSVLLAFAIGLAAWTLIEYLLHRFVFHRIAMIEQMHERHHAEPRELIGSPVWLSFIAFLVALVPLWLCLGFGLSGGAIAGLMMGYVWYASVHHAVHHWAIDDRSWLYAARMRHLRHHYGTPERNFGVTTAFWDYVFGTAPTSRRARPQMPT